jgi:hypothetical protein
MIEMPQHLKSGRRRLYSPRSFVREISDLLILCWILLHQEYFVNSQIIFVKPPFPDDQSVPLSTDIRPTTRPTVIGAVIAPLGDVMRILGRYNAGNSQHVPIMDGNPN